MFCVCWFLYSVGVTVTSPWQPLSRDAAYFSSHAEVNIKLRSAFYSLYISIGQISWFTPGISKEDHIMPYSAPASSVLITSTKTRQSRFEIGICFGFNVSFCCTPWSPLVGREDQTPRPELRYTCYHSHTAAVYWSIFTDSSFKLQIDTTVVTLACLQIITSWLS